MASKKDIISELQKNILHCQGFKVPLAGTTRFPGLEPVEAAFPNAVFPAGAIHEFLTGEQEHAAACGGFLGGLLKVLMENGGICLWISTSRSLFPPALRSFGIDPDRIIFIDLQRQRDLLWATEEALKCDALAAVVTEISKLSFTESRRLQLVVEKSRVTGFILRDDTHRLGSTTCAARWMISPLPSEPEDGLPGVGFPRWNVELLKVRNGNPGSWKFEWSEGRFKTLPDEKDNLSAGQEEKRQAG